MTRYRRFPSWLAGLLLACMACWSMVPPTAAAEDLRRNTSLKFIPADVSFYHVMLRNREQWEIFQASSAYQKLTTVPLVTFGLSMLEGQWQNSQREEIALLRELWEQEENQELVGLLRAAVADEIFMSGDQGLTELLRLGQELQRTMRAAQVRGATAEESDEETEQKLIRSAIGKLAQAKAPGMLIGFRIPDPAVAERQIARLEKLIKNLIDQRPELQVLADRVKREQVGDASFLTLTLDGSLIPWENLPEEARERIDSDLQNQLNAIHFVVSIGVRDGYLLLAGGDSLDHIRALGQGKLLIDRPELKPVRDAGDRRIVNVSYASQAFRTHANSNAGQIDDLVSTAEQLLPQAELEPEQVEALLKDVRDLATELKSFIPEPGPGTQFQFLTEQGYEGYAYDWGQQRHLDGAQPLAILQHVGGDPLGFYATGKKHSADLYDWTSKWLQRVAHHAEQIVIPRLSEAEQQRFEQIRTEVIPLLKRFDRATREDLLPGLGNGQGAFVLDRKATSKRWHEQLPATRVPLPMLELAVVYRVQDAAAVKRAAHEYYAIAQRALDIAHQLGQGEVPRVEIPAPEIEQTEAGTLYKYPIAERLGLDPQIAPNAGMSADTLVFSLMPGTTQRLLKPTPLKGTGPLADTSRPLAAASYFSLAGFFQTLTPWVQYGVRIANQSIEEDNAGARMGVQMVAGNVTPILELLQSLGETMSVTYIEGEATITHSAIRYADAK